MNERPKLEAWSAGFFLAALVIGVVLALPEEGSVRKRSHPSLAADLERTESSQTQGLHLTDLEGWTLTPHPDSEPEVLTRLSLDLDRSGQASVGALESSVSWRGLRLPRESRPGNSIVCSLNDVRVKLLLYKGQKPTLEAGPGVRVVLKTGDEVHENFAALAAAIKAWPLEAQIVFDARSGVPARHALTALAILCQNQRRFEIATPEVPLRPGYPSARAKAAIRAATLSVAKDERGLPLLGVRIRPDARCTWGAIQEVLEALVRERVSRLTLSGNAGDLEVDLFQAAKLRPREELSQIVEKPVVILEEEKPIIVIEEEEVETTVEIPGSERGVHPPVGVRDPSSADSSPLRSSYASRRGEGNVTAESEAAVGAALGWLKKHQRPDGTWRAEGNGCCDAKDEPADPRFDLSVSSLSLLAFLGNGQTHRFGRYKRVVNRGLRRLKALQKSDGSIGVSPDFPESTYNHAYAAQALCEAYALSRDFTLKRHARRALDWIEAGQIPGAGWRCDPTRTESDRALTCALVQALLAGRLAGLKVPAATISAAMTSLQSPTESSGGPAARSARAQGKFDPLPSDAALAVFTQLYGRSDPRCALAGTPLLLENLPTWDRLERKVDFHYWFAGSHAMFQVGGAEAQKWLAASRQALLPHQATTSCAAGSWALRGELGHLGGRAYATALGALCLEAPYRFERAPR